MSAATGHLDLAAAGPRPAPVPLGVVERIWRYPVKSMQGESLPAGRFEPRGLLGDRRYAVRDADGKLGSGKNSRRFRRFDALRGIAARYGPDGVVLLTLPDGRTVRADEDRVQEVLRAAVGQDSVRLAAETDVSHHDESPVHLVTTASLDWLAAAVPGTPVDDRRVRPNLLIRTSLSGLAEDSWVGQTLHIGGQVRLRVTHRTRRCAMVNAAVQDLPYSGAVLQAIAAGNDLTFGVQAGVLAGGTVRLGDPVHLG
jgi:uncharacterized protein